MARWLEEQAAGGAYLPGPSARDRALAYITATLGSTPPVVQTREFALALIDARLRLLQAQGLGESEEARRLKAIRDAIIWADRLPGQLDPKNAHRGDESGQGLWDAAVIIATILTDGAAGAAPKGPRGVPRGPKPEYKLGGPFHPKARPFRPVKPPSPCEGPGEAELRSTGRGAPSSSTGRALGGGRLENFPKEECPPSSKGTATAPRGVTGAFDATAEATGKGLGKFKNVKVDPTAEQLAKIENHLENFGDIPYNKAMVDRIKKAIAEGRQLEGADAHFYVHELGESGLMKFYMEKGGMSFNDAYKLAHQEMLDSVGASPFSLYHPDVIKQFPKEFSPAWIWWTPLSRPETGDSSLLLAGSAA